MLSWVEHEKSFNCWYFYFYDYKKRFITSGPVRINAVWSVFAGHPMGSQSSKASSGGQQRLWSAWSESSLGAHEILQEMLRLGSNKGIGQSLGDAILLKSFLLSFWKGFTLKGKQLHLSFHFRVDTLSKWTRCTKDKQGIAKVVFIVTITVSHFHLLSFIEHWLYLLQSNLNGSNVFGTMGICSRYG